MSSRGAPLERWVRSNWPVPPPLNPALPAASSTRTQSSAGSRPANAGTRKPRGLTLPAQDSMLQPLRWRCVDFAIRHERDVREEQKYICVAWASNNKRDCDAWSLLLLAAAVRSFAHMPLGISDRNNIQYIIWLEINFDLICYWKQIFCPSSLSLFSTL